VFNKRISEDSKVASFIGEWWDGDLMRNEVQVQVGSVRDEQGWERGARRYGRVTR
jgi:hypothetical protein